MRRDEDFFLNRLIPVGNYHNEWFPLSRLCLLPFWGYLPHFHIY